MIRIGCVSYLNATPLIDGLDAKVQVDVPARLLAALQRQEVDLALCPVIDYFRGTPPLTLVPVGGICCEGPTLTVRLFSKVPIPHISAVHTDSDSHTSAALLRVLLDRLHGLRPRFTQWKADSRSSPQAMLLIGDKVVTASPKAIEYPHQLDLGDAWKQLTGLPFVFATWMAAVDTDLGDLPGRLAALRERNVGRIADIVETHAPAHGWPTDLAEQYLGHILRYRVGPRELEAIQLFGTWAAELNIIDATRPLMLWDHISPPVISEQGHSAGRMTP